MGEGMRDAQALGDIGNGSKAVPTWRAARSRGYDVGALKHTHATLARVSDRAALAVAPTVRLPGDFAPLSVART